VAQHQPSETGALEIETPAGNQGKASASFGTFSWQREELDFLVHSPGRVRIALLSDHSGKLWFDDVRLEPLVVRLELIHFKSSVPQRFLGNSKNPT
jgi:hypothetical protein